MQDLGFGITVALRDMFTQNAYRVQAAMSTMADQSQESAMRMQQSFNQVMTGVALMGAGAAALAIPIKFALSTRETTKALGEMTSLGFQDLNALESKAREFSNDFAGTLTAQFVGAAYDIKSAISTLSDEGVAEFTRLAALTGKATKATTEEMTGLFATGYGIFKSQFAEMSDMDFGAMFSGGISKAVQQFKTTGPQMADAIKNIGALAASANVPMAEQLAILGQLQTTMPGSEAGTLYKSFIMKAAEAGNELGLAFTDAQGHMKGVVPIIQEIQKKFPDLASAAAQTQLKKAFGSDEAVKFVLSMSSQIGLLENNINAMGDAMKGGSATTELMAAAMNQDLGAVLQIMGQRWQNLQEILGKAVLPIIMPVAKAISNLVVFLQKMFLEVPGVTKVILGMSVAFGAALIAVGVLVSSMGMLGMLQVGLAALGTSLTGIMVTIQSSILAAFWPLALGVGLVLILREAWRRNWGGIQDTVVGFYNQFRLVWRGVNELITSMANGVGQMSGETAAALEKAGLLNFVVRLFMAYHRVQTFFAGFLSGLAAGFEVFMQGVHLVFNTVLLPIKLVVEVLIGAFRSLATVMGWVPVEGYDGLGKVLGFVAGVILSLVAAWKAWQVVVMIHRAALVVWAGVQTAIRVATIAWTVAQWALNVALNANPIGLVVLAVMALIGVAVLVVGYWKTIKGFFVGLFNLMPGWATIILAFAMPWVGIPLMIIKYWSYIKTFFVGLGSWLISWFTDFPLVRMVTNIFGAIKGLFYGDLSLFEAGKQVVWSLVKGIAGMYLYPVLALWKLVSGMLSFLGGLGGFFYDVGAEFIGSLVNGVKGLGGFVLDALIFILTPFAKIGDFLLSVLGSIGSVLLQFGVGVARFIGRGIASLASWVWGQIVAFFSPSGGAQAGAGLLMAIGSGILSAMMWPITAIKSVLSYLLSFLPGSGGGNASDGPLSGLLSIGASIIGTLVAGLLSVATAPARALFSILSWAFGGLGESVAGFFGNVLSSVTGWMGSAKDMASQALSAIGGMASDAFGGLANAAASAWGSVTSSVSSAVDSVTSRVASAWDAAKGLASSAWNSVAGLGGNILSSISGLAASAHDAVTSAFPGPTPAFAGIPASLNESKKLMPTDFADTMTRRDTENRLQNSNQLSAVQVSRVQETNRLETTSVGETKSLGGEQALGLLQQLVEQGANGKPIEVKLFVDGNVLARTVASKVRQEKVLNYGD